jgi:hypothetical protein
MKLEKSISLHTKHRSVDIELIFQCVYCYSPGGRVGPMASNAIILLCFLFGKIQPQVRDS